MTDRTTHYKSTYSKVVVQWFNHVLWFCQSLCLIYSEVLRCRKLSVRHLLVAENPCLKFLLTTTKRTFYLFVITSVLTFFATSCTYRDEKNNERPVKMNNIPKSLIPKAGTQALLNRIDRSHATYCDTLYFYCPPVPNSNSYMFEAGIFSPQAHVYALPNLKSKILDSLPFRTPINIQALDSHFYFICFPKGKAGYVKKTDTYQYQFGNLFFGIVNYSPFPDACGGEGNTLRVLDLSDSDVFESKIQASEYKIESISPALENVKSLFKLLYVCHSEMGATEEWFIVKTDRLRHFFKVISSGDGGDFWHSKIYIPVQLNNGKKIILARNGQLTVNPETGLAETLSYPKNCGIPIEELVVEVSESGIYAFSESSGDEIYNTDGSIKIKYNERITTYYRWNGTSLKKVKTIKNI